MCIGYKLAEAEYLAVMQYLLSHYTFRLADGQVPLPLTFVTTLRALNGVCMHVEKRDV